MCSAQTLTFLQYPQCSTLILFTSQHLVGSTYNHYQDNRSTFGASTAHNLDIIVTEKRRQYNAYSDIISEAIASINMIQVIINNNVYFLSFVLLFF
jgi:hypothetical protein